MRGLFSECLQDLGPCTCVGCSRDRGNCVYDQGGNRCGRVIGNTMLSLQGVRCVSSAQLSFFLSPFFILA